jgi:hypothetical protein
MIHIYHPSKSLNGSACSFWIGNEGSLFATILKQSGWDNETRTGTFKASVSDATKKVNIKLSEIEVCSILDCIDRGRSFSTYHDNDDSPKSITFSPWLTGEPKSQKGFSFSITLNNSKNSFYIGLTFAEARYVREFLMHFLQTAFSNKTKPQKIKEPIQL